jgi:hypothetical protein
MALCGVLAALATVCLFLGGAIPVASLSCPILASLVLIPVYLECGKKWGALWYVVVGILGLLLAPYKECAVLFVAYGAYPMLRKYLGRLPLGRLWKTVYFHIVLFAAYGIMLFVFPLPELQGEFADMGKLMLGVMVLMSNVCFWLYDIMISRLEVMYFVRLRPKLKFL